MKYPLMSTLLLLLFPLFTSALYVGGNPFAFLGSIMTDIPQTLDLEEHVPSPLSLWSKSKTQSLCNATGKEEFAPDSLSSRDTRLSSISAPLFFRDIAIRGDWDYTSRRLAELDNCAAASEFVR